MKTKALLVVLSVICLATVSRAQQKFNVQNGTKTEFYDDLETAIQKAVSGDTIYLPGKVIQVQNDVIIDKKLAIIGAGCDVDSIGGLQTTEIKKSDGNNLTINFRNGSDGSLLMGCIVGKIQFGNGEAQQNIQNVTIWRNKINLNITLGASPTNNLVKQIIISENIIDGCSLGDVGITGNDASDCIISNNLCCGWWWGAIRALKNSHIYNNVLVAGAGNTDWPVVRDLQECVVENNFFVSPAISNCSNSSFNNNAFTGNVTFPVGSNSGNNNLMNQTTQQTFEVDDLTYPKNLKIRATSPCKNAGTDGTDIGIFGGPAPYKAGAVPFNPHVTRSSIAGQTDKDGKLKVNIQVSAQTR